jgi:DNA-binding NarL/FixJ family response regulator
MRKWTPAAWRHDGPGPVPGEAMAQMIAWLGEDGFADRLLRQLHPALPVASWSVYRVGPGCAPRLFMSAALDIPDTTRDCWEAYLSGPHRRDRSLRFDAADAVHGRQLCHITAQEVPPAHRALVYEAHGVAERVSVVQHAEDEALFAVNFYRHTHQRALTDAQIGGFEQLAPALLALARKHVALRAAAGAPDPRDAVSPQGASVDPSPPAPLRERLLQCDAALTARELDVCTRLLRGMTHDGIAADLGLSLPTVKTYRNRAFARLGIHFRSELFARVMAQD